MGVCVCVCVCGCVCVCVGWGVNGDDSIVIEDLCEDGMRNLGGRLVQMLMRAGILFGGVAVVAVG